MSGKYYQKTLSGSGFFDITGMHAPQRRRRSVSLTASKSVKCKSRHLNYFLKNTRNARRVALMLDRDTRRVDRCKLRFDMPRDSRKPKRSVVRVCPGA